MEYRVSKSNISSRRRSNEKKRGKRKTKAASQTWQSRKKNKKATEPAFTVRSHFSTAGMPSYRARRVSKKRRMPISCTLPQLENSLSALARNWCLLFVHHVSYVSHMSSKRKKKQGKRVLVACDKHAQQRSFGRDPNLKLEVPPA